MFFDVKNWAKNTRLACKVRKKLNYSWKERPLDQIQWCTKKNQRPWELRPWKFVAENGFFGLWQIRFKLGLRRPMLPFPMLQTLRDSQSVSNSDFRGFWFCVLRPKSRLHFYTYATSPPESQTNYKLSHSICVVWTPIM